MRPKTSNKILECLRTNSRTKLKEMSRSTQIPVSTLYDTLKYLQQTVIKKFTIILDFYKLGYNTKAILCLKPQMSMKKEFQHYLKYCNEINSLFKANDDIYIAEIILKDNQALSKFIEKIQSKFNIETCYTHLVYEVLKKESFVPKLV